MPSPIGRWRSRGSQAAPGTTGDRERTEYLNNPGDRTFFDRWLDSLRDSDRSEDDVCDELAEVQDQYPEPIPLVLVHLLANDTVDEVRRERSAASLAAFSASEPARACQQVWGDFARLRRLDEVAVAAVLSLRPVVRQLSFLTADPRYRRVGGLTASPWPADHVVPAKAPWSEALPEVDVEWIRRVAVDFLAPGSPTPAGPDRRQFATEFVAGVVARFEHFIGFQDRLLRDGGLPFPDPTQAGGRQLQPFDALVAFDRTIYSYAGRELFQVIAGGAGSRALGVYLPASNVMVDFEAGMPRLVSGPLMANLLAMQLGRLVQLSELYDRCIASGTHRRPKPTRSIVVGVGRAENFAHHLWNYYPGLQRIVEDGLADRATELHSAGTEFFGPYRGSSPSWPR